MQENQSHKSVESSSFFSKGELEQLKAALKRTYKERFEMATRLYKVHQTMKKATISHKPFIAR